MAGAHQIAADILARADEVTQRLLLPGSAVDEYSGLVSGSLGQCSWGFGVVERGLVWAHG